MTDYKVQNLTLQTAVLNLCYSRMNSKNHNQNTIMREHKKFCFTYVQFFRLRSFQNLRFLKSINVENLKNKSHFLLIQKMKRLTSLNIQTQKK